VCVAFFLQTGGKASISDPTRPSSGSFSCFPAFPAPICRTPASAAFCATMCNDQKINCYWFEGGGALSLVPNHSLWFPFQAVPPARAIKRPRRWRSKKTTSTLVSIVVLHVCARSGTLQTPFHMQTSRQILQHHDKSYICTRTQLHTFGHIALGFDAMRCDADAMRCDVM
jgi:hypothetical protein